MGDDEEAVENAEGKRRHGEEIHRGDGFAMIVQKGRPSLCRFRNFRRFSHPAQHSSSRNIEAKHLQLTIDARRTPGWVLCDHAEDEIAQFPADAFSSNAGLMPRKPRPIQFEPCLRRNILRTLEFPSAVRGLGEQEKVGPHSGFEPSVVTPSEVWTAQVLMLI